MNKLAISIILGLFVACGQLHANEAVERVKSVYEREMANIETDFRDARLALPPQHITVLRNMESYFQGEGNLSALVAVQQARQKFVVDPTPSGLTSLQEPDVLAKLERRFQDQYAAAANSRYERISGLQDQYRSALIRLQTQLTRDGQIQDAQMVSGLVAAIEPVAPVEMPEPTPGAVVVTVSSGGGPASGSPQGPSNFKSPQPDSQGLPRDSFDQLFDEWFD